MKKAVAWALCALWMGVIFSMSAQPAVVSDTQSGQIVGLTQWLLSLLNFDYFSIPPEFLHVLIRKLAHFGEYAVLSLLYRRALQLSGAKRATLAAIALSALYAATDELHQGFVDGRSPQMTDVAIDTFGACAGAWFHQFVSRHFPSRSA
ncbi:MAG: VanZ family protein [Clostridia bacterium]|nr:VanZ family protein [Clostridia bacterium]